MMALTIRQPWASHAGLGTDADAFTACRHLLPSGPTAPRRHPRHRARNGLRAGLAVTMRQAGPRERPPRSLDHHGYRAPRPARPIAAGHARGPRLTAAGGVLAHAIRMRPKDMMISQRPRGGFRVTFESVSELVTIDASAERLNAWASSIAAVTDRACGNRGRSRVAPAAGQ